MLKNKKVFSHLMLLALLMTAGLVIRAQVGAEAGTLSLGPPSASSYLLGETVKIPGAVDDVENATVTLDITGPLSISQDLPTTEGSYVYPATDLRVDVVCMAEDGENGSSSGEGVAESSHSTLPGSTLPGSTIPESTLPDSTLPGTGCADGVDYLISWDAPFLVTPAPSYATVPATAQRFPIPLVTPTPLASVAGLQDLPQLTEKFEIPQVGTPASGLPSAVPSVELLFEVPVVPTTEPVSGAPDPLPSVTEAFDVPLASTPTAVPGAPDDLPISTYAFDVPLASTPTPVAGAPDELGTLTEAYDVPLASTPTPVAGAPDELDTLTEAFDVPLASTPTAVAGAPADLGTLTEAYDVPLASTPTPVAGAPADLGTLTEAFDVPTGSTPTPETGAVAALDSSVTSVFSVPTAPTPTPVSGVADLDAVVGGTALAEAFAVPGTGIPLGITTDGTSFWVLVDDSPDKIYKVDSSGSVQTSWATSGVKEVTLNNEGMEEAQAIALVRGYLYVAENSYREDGDGSGSILKFDVDDGAEVEISGDNSCAIPNWDTYYGLTADGSRMWGTNYWGDLRKISKTCSESSSQWTDESSSRGVALGSGDNEYFFQVNEGTIYKYAEGDSSPVASWAVDEDFDIQGITYSSGTLFIADGDSEKVYKASIPHGQTVTTNPRGIAYDGTSLYILVDASPKDKVVVVDPADTSSPPTIIRTLTMPAGVVDAITYNSTDTFLYIGVKVGYDRKLCKIHRVTGNVLGTCTDLESPIHDELGGLAYNGTNLVGFLKSNNRDFYTISVSDGAAESADVQCCEAGNDGYTAAAYRTSTSKAYGANDNKIYEFTSGGDARQTITLASSYDIQGMVFIDANLFLANDADNTVYKGSIPHGVAVTNDPRALAVKPASGSDPAVLYVLTDAEPFDKIIAVDPDTGVASLEFDAPDGQGEGLTYMGGFLYYATNEGDNRIYKLNATTGAQEGDFRAQNEGGWEFSESYLGLGNDGSDLILSYTDSWSPCFYKINETNGSNNGRLCENDDYDSATKSVKAIAVTPDGQYVLAKDDKIERRNEEGNARDEWDSLTATDIQGMVFIDTVLYVADDGNDKIYKAALPHGVTTTRDPLALAYKAADGGNPAVMYVLTDGTPFDKIVGFDPDTGVASIEFDAPDGEGEGLTYMGGFLYYATNEGDNRIYKLNATTGAQEDDFRAQNESGYEFGESYLGLDNDGSDLILSYANSWSPCFYKINEANGSNSGRLCDDDNWESAEKSPKAIAVTPDGDYVVARDDKIERRDESGNGREDWDSLAATDIQGMVFADTVLYVADSGSDKIYKAALPHGVVTTQDPLALAYKAEDGGNPAVMYVLTDGEPLDKIIGVDPDTGVASIEFDAPDGEGQGLTYLGGFLYYASKFGDVKIYKLNATTGAQEDDFRPMNFDGWEMHDTIIGMSNDGSDLVVAYQAGGTSCLYKIKASNGDNEGRFCQEMDWESALKNPTGLAVSPDGKWLMGKSDTIVKRGLNPDNNQLEEEDRWENLAATDIQGMTFAGTVMYVADAENNKVYKTSIPHGIVTTQDPLALAYNSTDNLLYVLTDGEPFDKIVGFDPDTGVASVEFDAPDDEGQGLTYLGGYLYYASQSGDSRIYKLDPATGAQEDNFRPQSFHGGDLYEAILGMGNDGSDLVISYNDNWNGHCRYLISPNDGDNEGQFCQDMDWDNALKQATGITVSPSDHPIANNRDVILVAKDDEIAKLASDGNSELERWENLSATDIQGMVFAGSVVYVADAGTGKIYSTALPHGIETTQDPLALTYNSTDNLLYVLTDGTPYDKIVAVDPESGTTYVEFDAPNDGGEGLVYVEGYLYYASNTNNAVKIYKLDANTGAEEQDFSVTDQSGWPLHNQVYGMSYDGTDLVIVFNQGGRGEGCYYLVKIDDGEIEGENCGNYGEGIVSARGVVLSAEGYVIVAKDEAIKLIDGSGNDIGDWTSDIAGDIEGITLVGNVIYFADADSSTIYKGSVPHGVVTSRYPHALAFDESGGILYVLTAGYPYDKILAVDPATGDVSAEFNAPDKDGQGLTFMDGYLYYASNPEGGCPPQCWGSDKTIFKLDPSDGSQVGDFVPQDEGGHGPINDSLLGLGNDGTSLLLTVNRWNDNRGCVHYIDPANGNNEGRRCGDFGEGLDEARGVDVASDGYLLMVKDNNVYQATANGANNEQWTNLTPQNINGSAIGNGVVYLADWDSKKIYSASVPAGVQYTTNPKAVTVGESDGSNALFVLVDGKPNDKILVVDPSSGSLRTYFGAPTSGGENMTYVGDSLYVTGPNWEGKLSGYELDPADGAVTSSGQVRDQWGGDFWMTLSGLSNDGDDLVFANGGCVYTLNPNNWTLGYEQPCGQSGFNPGGLARSSDGSIFLYDNGQIQRFAVGDTGLSQVGSWNLDSGLDIKGLEFSGEVLYLVDSTNDSFYWGSKPSGISTEAQGLAYDGSNLYILVDGDFKDHIIVVDSDTGVVSGDFPAPSKDTHAIAYVDADGETALWVTTSEQQGGGGGHDPYCPSCGGPQMSHWLWKLDAATGQVLNPGGDGYQIQNVDPNVGGMQGLTYNGEVLIAVPDDNGPGIVMDLNGNLQSEIWFYGGYVQGYNSYEYFGDRNMYLATRDMNVMQLSEDGEMLENYQTNRDYLKGMAVVGGAVYFAAGGQDKSDSNHSPDDNFIVAATVPAPPSVSTNDPRGLATDGTNLYVLVEGEPNDRIIVLDKGTGALVNDYDAPSAGTVGLAILGGELYALTNEQHPNFGDMPAVLYRINPNNGEVLAENELTNSIHGGSSTEHRAMGNLTSDGSNNLYATLDSRSTNFDNGYGGQMWYGGQDGAQWVRINPGNSRVEMGENGMWEHSGQGDFKYQHGDTVIAHQSGAGIPDKIVSFGYTDAGPSIALFHPSSGDAYEDFILTGNYDVQGMAYSGTELFMADANNSMILVTSLPDNVPETTNVGSYQASLRVEQYGETENSDPVAFAVVRNTTVKVNITSPAPNFAVINPVLPVSGLVTEPAASTVRVGVLLPFTELFRDEATVGESESKWTADGMWHISCGELSNANNADGCHWRFGDEGGSGFGRDTRSSGTLAMADAILVGPGAQVSFDTWYETEQIPDADLKIVEVAVQTIDEYGNEVLTPWETLVQIVGPGFGGSDIPTDYNDGQPVYQKNSIFYHYELDPGSVFFTEQGDAVPGFQNVWIDLDQYIGDFIKIRFRFDTLNEYYNNGRGWFVDNVVLEGEGLKLITAAVEALEEPVVTGADTYYGSFDTNVNLGVGFNRVVAVVEQPYIPKPSGDRLGQVKFRVGYLDLVGPDVNMSGIEPVVRIPRQQITGTVEDVNFEEMVIHQSYVAQGEVQERLLQAFNRQNVPSDGQFALTVNLLEGANTFRAVATDGSGNESVTTYTVRLDTAGPTITPLTTKYPLGYIKARAGDLVVLTVDAVDNLSVDRVLVSTYDGEKQMYPAESIPPAVLNQWQAFGGFVLPYFIPEHVSEPFPLTVYAFDAAGNQSQGEVFVNVGASLDGYSFKLLPGQNLISLPLKPTGSSVIADLLGGDLLTKIDTIMYYDASLTDEVQEDRWLIYSPDAPSYVNTLTTMETGRGYWIKMKDGVFDYDAPLGPGLPATPRPIVFNYLGAFLEPGAVPPSYTVVTGWNLVGYHSEDVLAVTTALQSLEVPVPIWASLYQYDNLIEFSGEGDVEIVLGGFKRVLPAGDMHPGKGYWVYMVRDGVIVP